MLGINFFLVLFIFYPFLRVNGEFTYEDWTLRLDETKLMKSINYPEFAPNNLRQVWTIRSLPNAIIEIKCEHFEIPESFPCGESFSIIDSGVEEKFCGVKNDFTYLSKGGLLISLVTSDSTTGRLRCTATAVNKKDSSDKWSYLDIISEEVDSNEYGGPKGKKSNTCECGWANKDHERIFNGKETKVNEFPFLSGLMYEEGRFVFCGASIITPYHALTAAHCIHNKTQGSLQIDVGEHNRLTDSETNVTTYVKVAKHIPHPKYSWEGQLNDIGVLLLESKIHFNKFVGPVCLPNSPINLDYKYVTVIGWGGNGIYSSMSPFLQKVHVRVLPKQLCTEFYSRIPEGSPNQICVHRNKKSSCFGDSGGPLVWIDPETNRYTQVGLVSYGSTQCGDYIPRVATDVRSYMDWILEVIKDTNPEERPCWKAL